MEEEGAIRQLPNRKYELTELGRREIRGWPIRVRTSGPKTVDEVLEQMSGYVSYLEDLAQSDRGNLLANSARIRDISSRLSRLGEG
jgi:DNA-binding PadR family transcriptional regulator